MKLKIVLTILLAGSSFVDQRSSLHVFHNGWHEMNPLYGSQPSGPRFVFQHSAIDAAEVVALWKARGKAGKVAKLVVLGNIANNSLAAAHNYNLPEHPGGRP